MKSALLGLVGLAFPIFSLVVTGCGAPPERDDPADETGGSTESGTGTGTPGGAGGGTAGSAGAGGDTGSGPGAVDQCPMPTGIEVNGQKRFMYGVNYAWNNFATDFGGLAKWSQKSVSQDPSPHEKNLKDMRAHGASTIRWWMFPEFRGEGVKFDGSDTPIGLGDTVVEDINKALELAEQADVSLMLTLFSFDNFRPTKDADGIHTPGLSPIVRDAAKLNALIENVVLPLARAAEKSPYRHRLVAWDVINEPEWAMSGSNPYGDPEYDPGNSMGLDKVNHAQMEELVKRTIDALHKESSAQVSVGSAGLKWVNAWRHVDVDFYQYHTYDWVNDYWPYDMSPKEYGIDDKPVVMGEFPMNGLTGVPFDDMLESWYTNGYAGAMAWAYTDPAFSSSLDNVKPFADKHPCETHYGNAPSGSGASDSGASSSSSSSSSGSSSSGGAACTDVPPDAVYTCEQQVGWGKCDEPWMKDFCDKSCGRCG